MKINPDEYSVLRVLMVKRPRCAVDCLAISTRNSEYGFVAQVGT